MRDDHLIGPFLCSTGHRRISTLDGLTFFFSIKASTTGVMGANRKCKKQYNEYNKNPHNNYYKNLLFYNVICYPGYCSGLDQAKIEADSEIKPNLLVGWEGGWPTT